MIGLTEDVYNLKWDATNSDRKEALIRLRKLMVRMEALAFEHEEDKDFEMAYALHESVMQLRNQYLSILADIANNKGSVKPEEFVPVDDIGKIFPLDEERSDSQPEG